MTVLEVIQRSTEFLAKKGIESPRLQTELLLAHLLALPRMQLYLNFERSLTATELDSFRGIIKRRAEREPVQYITGTTSFCGFEIAVNREVLIPRPETELLAEQGWTFLSQIAHQAGAPCSPETSTFQPPQHETESSQGPVALDYGTGSGCLAIALASKCRTAQIHATDISAGALALAQANAARHGLGTRVRFYQGDGFGAVPASLGANLIIANPPYIPSAEIATLQPEVRDYEPPPALDGGPDGLDYYRRLSVEAVPFLASRGKIMMELGAGQADAVRELFEAQKWIVEAILPDYTQCPRIAIAHRPA